MFRRMIIALATSLLLLGGSVVDAEARHSSGQSVVLSPYSANVVSFRTGAGKIITARSSTTPLCCYARLDVYNPKGRQTVIASLDTGATQHIRSHGWTRVAIRTNPGHLQARLI